jgi:hypothetical protein
MSLPSTEELVPAIKQKGISNYADLLSLAREFHLGDEASRDLFGKGKGLILKVTPILGRHAVEPDGKIHKTWNALSPIRCANIVRDMHKVAPWFLRFEEAWATKWVARRLINQRVHDSNRSKKKERDADREAARQQQEEEAAAARERGLNESMIVEGKISGTTTT